MNKHRLNTSFGCLLFACLLCGAVQAQSGRHQPPPHAEAPVPTPTPEPPKVKPPPTEQIHVLVTSSAPASVSLSSFDVSLVADTLLQRLNASDALKVETANSMSRDGAHKRAKEEKERFIIWFQLQYDGFNNTLSPNPEDLRIEYAIYQPGTGASKAGGTVFLRTVRTVPVIGSGASCYPNLYGLNGSLTIGALETADRIFDALSVPSPPLCK